jgi:hypothetical protein
MTRQGGRKASLGAGRDARKGGAVMDQLKWIVQMAAAALTVLALIDEGRKRGWV